MPVGRKGYKALVKKDDRKRYEYLSDKSAARLKAKQEREGLASYQLRKSKNPLPVGRMVTVRAIRRKNGQVDLYR